MLVFVVAEELECGALEGCEDAATLLHPLKGC